MNKYIVILGLAVILMGAIVFSITAFQDFNFGYEIIIMATVFMGTIIILIGLKRPKVET